MRNYEDIIGLPHHVSPTRPRMSAHDRAAQFSPFSALTGYDAVIDRTKGEHASGTQWDEGGGVFAAVTHE